MCCCRYLSVIKLAFHLHYQCVLFCARGASIIFCVGTGERKKTRAEVGAVFTEARASAFCPLHLSARACHPCLCQLCFLSPVSLLYLTLRSSRSGKNLCRERIWYIGIVLFSFPF